jgi:hypothetical protein
MSELEKLKELFENHLKPGLKGIEKERKTIKRFYIGAVASAVFAFLIFPVSWILGVLFLLAAIVLGGFGATKYVTKYRPVYKNEVVRKIIEMINPEYHYDPNKFIAESKYTESRIFKQSHDRCQGDDFVSGKIDKTDFEFSELKTEYQREYTDDDGKRQKEWVTVFQGLFFHADFNKHIDGETFVLTDITEKRFGKFAQKFQKDRKRGELVKLENPEFEKAFKVFSSSQQEARYILTPTMMEAMADMQKRFRRPMQFSFIGERVYCAISFDKGLFEPRVMKTGVKFSDVEEMYCLFSLIETIIQEMNLNTRIWTKK